MTPSAYAALRDRAVAMTDQAREEMIAECAAKAMANAGVDHVKAREYMQCHALLVKGRSRAAVERMEREMGLR